MDLKKKKQELELERQKLENIIQQRTKELQLFGNAYQQLLGQLQLLESLSNDNGNKK